MIRHASTIPDTRNVVYSRRCGGGEDPRPSAMVAYVAVTRARMLLDRGGLAWIDKHQRRR